MTRRGVLLLATLAWGGCDPPTGLGRLPSPADVPEAEAEPPTAPLRCGVLARADAVNVDSSRGQEFAADGETFVAGGGPWTRGATNRTGALVVPDAECGVRVFEREDDAGTVSIRHRGCVAGLHGTGALQLFFNQNVSGLCAVHEDGSLRSGRFDIAQAAFTSHLTVGGSAARCGIGDWWATAITRDAMSQRRLQFLDDFFRPNGPLYTLPVEAGDPRPIALVNNLNRWDALWSVDDGRGLLHERYRPLGETAPGGAYPSRLDGFTREGPRIWSASREGATRVQVFDAFDKGGGLFALARLEAPGRAWVDGLFFCAGAEVRARRLHERSVLDAMLVGLGAAHVLLTVHRDGDEQVVSATWISSDFSTRGRPQVLRHAPGLTLLGADVGPRVGSFLVWHARPADGSHALYVSTYVLTR